MQPTTFCRPRSKAGEFELCTSEVLLAELLEVLSRARFNARLGQAGLIPQGIVDDLRRIAIVVQGIPIVTAREAVERLQARGKT